MSERDERHYYQPTFGFLFEDDMSELLEDFDPEEYQLFWPADELDPDEDYVRDERMVDMYDQLSYMADHSD